MTKKTNLQQNILFNFQNNTYDILLFMLILTAV